MATFQTGRMRTITFSGNLVGSTEVTGIAIGDLTAVSQTESEATIICQGFTLHAYAFSKWDTQAFSHLEVDITAPDGYYNSQTYTNPPDSEELLNTSLSMDGSWIVSVDVEEWASVYTPSTSEMIDKVDFPTYGGSAQGDGLPAIGIQYYEATRVGGNLSATITAGMFTESHNISITSSNVVG